MDTSIQRWRDPHGAIHDVPNPTTKQTENAPLFYGTYIVLCYATKTLSQDESWNFLNYVEKLRAHGYWSATPGSMRDDFSKDNGIGVSLALRVIIKYARSIDHNVLEVEAEEQMDAVELFHKQAYQAWFTIAYAKYEWNWCGKIVRLRNKVTCQRTHKKHSDRPKGQQLEATTSGKILALITWLANDWPEHLLFHDECLFDYRKYPGPKRAKAPYNTIDGEKKWFWTCWTSIFFEYYGSVQHPSVMLVCLWEKQRAGVPV